MVRVKICGLTRDEDVEAAIVAGADAVGFIVGFLSSPRNLTLDAAAKLMGRVSPFADAVLVTTCDVVKTNAARIRTELRPDTIQLYGDSMSPSEVREALGVRLVIRPFLMRSSASPSEATLLAKREAEGFDALLTDTYVKGSEGGTGKTSDWSACAAVRSALAPIPLILSGGLNPSNVEEAVRRVRPYAVDASSGVESSPGIKDHHRVAAFIRLATRAEVSN